MKRITQRSAVDYGHCFIKECSQGSGVKSACKTHQALRSGCFGLFESGGPRSYPCDSLREHSLQMNSSQTFSIHLFENSLQAPMKFVPWAHLRWHTGLLIVMSTRSVFMNVSVVRSSSVSMCTPLEHMQANDNPYRFISFLPSFMMKGPKQSIQHVKGGDVSVLSSKRSAIHLTSVALLCLLYFTHLDVWRDHSSAS